MSTGAWGIFPSQIAQFISIKPFELREIIVSGRLRGCVLPRISLIRRRFLNGNEAQKDLTQQVSKATNA